MFVRAYDSRCRLLVVRLFFFLRIRRPPRSTQGVSSAASDVYKRQVSTQSTWGNEVDIPQTRSAQMVTLFPSKTPRHALRRDIFSPQQWVDLRMIYSQKRLTPWMSAGVLSVGALAVAHEN
eukprot:TRINITY_DN1619_c0_g2_i2.p4 TRINITY_DN1619_c0_g2~~TRINITY_DN1619_c0_g2_i2.p4  ORF type:complete len:121 (-),score=17.56 TRINITY_DN1619_c0_g2_i2:569-931(-)